MRMKVYADATSRYLAQLCGDVLAVAWTIVSVRAAFAVHERLVGLAEPARALQDAGAGLRDEAAGVRGQVRDVPGVGDSLGAPFDALADAGGSIASVGRTGQQTVRDAALAVAVVVCVLALSIVVIWIVVRVRWIVRATRTRTLAQSVAGQSLLALRALTMRPARVLLRIADDPADAWRQGDADVVAALAAVELRSFGLRAARAADRTH
jgi:hypothetical protein